ncbi:uncharacterized protein [Panulirus ornatus]|uniref:uncharacterized protein isoform X2 n=1 Tax=Panulirus ornatus TaxID=150431 RepID=UPI003A867547
MPCGELYTRAIAQSSWRISLAPLWLLCLSLPCLTRADEERSDWRIWVWSEGTSLSPHGALPRAISLPSCEDSPSTKCLFTSPTPMSWDAAHSYCRSLEGFLVSRDEYRLLKDTWNAKGTTNLTWTALTPYNGHYQWLSRCPAPSEFVTWRELPEPWARECAALDVRRQEFQLHACADQLPFHCVLHKQSHSEGLDYDGGLPAAGLDEDVDLSDVELRVEGSTPPNHFHGWYSLPESYFLELTLSCRAYSRFTGELLPLQPKVFWRKDLVYTSHCVADMKPATIHDATKSEADGVVPGVTEVAPLFINQGTYWCEAWLPGSPKRLTSNKVLVTLNDRLVVLFNAHKREAPPGNTVEEAKEKLRDAFRSQFNNISSYTLDVIAVEKEVVPGSSDILAKYSFHLHMNISQLESHVKDIQNRVHTYERIYTQRGYLRSSSVRLPTFCFREKNSFGTGHKLQWPFTPAGDVHPRNYKCKVKYNELAPGRCEWNYTQGARLTLDPTSCDWEDLCPRGYTSVSDTCVSVSASDTWARGFSNIYNNSQEMSLIELTRFLSRRKWMDVREAVKRLVVEGTAQGKIWLPIRRLRRLSPLTLMSPHQLESNYWQYNTLSDYNISWAEEHPRSNEDCLALDMDTNQLQTSGCNTHLPFVVITNGKFLKRNPSRFSESLVTSSRGCPSGWNSTIFKSDSEICFKLFVSQRNLTWQEASNFCEEMYAQLPSPNVGFLDWVYRQHLYNHNVANTWMGVKRIHGRLLYNGSVDNINWMADTDYSQKYGTLTQFGWTLEGEEVTKQNIICQQRNSPEKSLLLQIHEPRTETSQTMCIDAEHEELLLNGDSSTLRCYVNGEYTRHEQTMDSGCQYELKVSNQGYYQCQAWAQPPLTLEHSNVFLHRDPRTFTFVVTLSQDERYRPEFHDSTFIIRQRGRRTSEKCIEVFMAKLRSSNLTLHYRFTPRNFFYLPEADSRLLHNFHLECEISERYSTLTEPQLLETLTDMFPIGEDFSSCTLGGIRSTVGCPREVTLNYASGPDRNLTWPETQGNSVVIPQELCITPEGEPVTRECLGDFLEGYYWDAAGNCTGEPSEITRRLWEINRDPGSYLRSPTSLANLTSNSSSLQPVDIHLIAKTFETFATKEEGAALNLDEIVETVNNVMGGNGSVFEKVQKKLNSTGILLESFEKLTFQVELPKEKGDQKMSSSRELISVQRLDLEVNSKIVGYKSRETAQAGQQTEMLLMGVTPADLEDAEVAIIFPSNLTFTIAARATKKARSRVLEEEKVPLAFAVYRNEKLFQDNLSITNYTVNSRIIQASFKGETVKDLEYPVQIYFKPLVDGNDTKCVFWDTTKNEGLGGWSEEGCRKGQRTGQQDLCLCNHLTNFALLINFDENSGFNGVHAKALDVITIIGCSFSIIGLLLVFTTFFLFKKWRRSLSNKILVNLSFSVFCSVVIFMAGINQTRSVILCRGVAVGLHYFILASFGWMLVEAVHQYLKFVKVVGTYIPRFLWKASICAWGIPVLPILVVLVYDSSLYDSNKDYNINAKICWMSPDGFKFAFLPPLVATMTVNLIMFSLIIHGAVCGRARVTSTMSERTLFMNQLRMAICVFFLLGFTWIFGLLAVCEMRIVFSYLFCIFNTLQGFFLFLFHVFRERSARKYWSDFLSVLTQDPVSSSPGNSDNMPQSGQFREHRDSVTFDKCGGILVLPQGPVRPHLRRTVRTSLLSARTASTLVPSRASFSP